MEEKNMWELSMEEMNKISGGGIVEDEYGQYYVDDGRCKCGGRWYVTLVSGGCVNLECRNCGSVSFGGQ